jgi:hypothetical protein
MEDAAASAIAASAIAVTLRVMEGSVFDRREV